MQLGLLDTGQPRSQPRRVELDGGDVVFDEGFLPEFDAVELLKSLLENVPWKQDTITMFGREHLVPRLHQWYGDEGTVYRWSGVEMRPLPWPAGLARIREHVESVAGVRFNSLLLNLYRNGDDTVGWHADDEPALGSNPVIASVSLGASRDFVLRRRKAKGEKVSIQLSNGSLLVMRGDTQTNWEHSVPRRKRVREPRVNLTFRRTVIEGGPSTPS